ncbi:hypothetical protein [Citrobacter portucalensis]|uniref:hypothetical protein n=1 Tax=Citrobacter portucalensis TaxID=1639133 RepID=UPI00226B615C|nr:hypothetical protein [Citrobacter portucalensis]MCX9070646.1 hypothetical protein [Citrobacter portucalensis]
MNYSRVYKAIIDRAIKLRGHPLKLHSYIRGYEIHHIRPASFFDGGRANSAANDPVNLAYLTLREHFLAHWLLARMHGGKMLLAFAIMCNRLKKNGRMYEHYRVEGLKARNADPEYIRRNLEGAAKREANPEYVERRNNGIRKAMSTPEYKIAHRAGIVRAMEESPGFTENLAAIQQDPVRRALASKGCSERNADPVFQARAEAGLKRVRNTPKFRAAMLEGTAKREATPGFKERRRAGTDLARARPGFWEHHQAAIDKRAENNEWRANSYAAAQRRNKTVIGTNIKTGEEIQLHGKQEMLDAGFNNKSISACITRPERSKSYKGYTWRFAVLAD